MFNQLIQGGDMTLVDYEKLLPKTMLPRHKKYLVQDYAHLKTLAKQLGLDGDYSHQQLIDLLRGDKNVYTA